eukprot:COSAG01_NODE_227_length_21107_cov_85.615099_13_plen_243_part_00
MATVCESPFHAGRGPLCGWLAGWLAQKENTTETALRLLMVAWLCSAGWEGLTPAAAADMSYYEKWASSITVIMLERGVLSEARLAAARGRLRGGGAEGGPVSQIRPPRSTDETPRSTDKNGGSCRRTAGPAAAAAAGNGGLYGASLCGGAGGAGEAGGSVWRPLAPAAHPNSRCGAVASFVAAVLTEMCLCDVCSCQEMLRRNGAHAGYCHGVVGVVERVCGVFASPEQLAFGGGTAGPDAG